MLTYELALFQNLWSKEQAEKFLLTAKIEIRCIAGLIHSTSEQANKTFFADGFLPRYETRGIKFSTKIFDFDVEIIANEDSVDDGVEDSVEDIVEDSVVESTQSPPLPQHMTTDE